MPTIAHLLDILRVLLIGISIGFVLGARAARAELERQQRLKER